MTQDSNYKSPASVLASVYGNGNNSSPTEANTSHLDATAYVDQGVVRSTDATPVSVQSGWSYPVRNSAGMPIADPAAVAPDHIVDLGPAGGGETTVEVAIMMGLLTRNAAGHVVPVGSATVPQQQQEAGDQEKEQQQQQPQDEPNPALDPESEAIVANALTHAQGEAIGVAVSIIEKDGEITDASVAQLAARLGQEPAEARAQIEKARDAYVKEAVTHTAKTTGTTDAMAQEALHFAQKNNPQAFRRAAEEHWMTGKPSYDHLVREYVAELGTKEPRRILEAATIPGYSARWDAQSGQVLLRFQGQEMSWGDAVRLGYIMLKQH
jgi:hypothetical protein